MEQRRQDLLTRIELADSIEKRFAVLVVLLYPENQGRYKALQHDTGNSVRASHWNHVTLGKQRITSRMIQLFGGAYPQFIFWMTTGIENEQHQGPRGLVDAYMEVCEKPRIKRLF